MTADEMQLFYAVVLLGLGALILAYFAWSDRR